ncbi:hypothetical protein E2I00_012593 [Balaenoptera physalus]|uniref:Uncharacterized protein n=1 Tax=Balaenoptera physalus TaxID=9770 RepID=A0A643C987_BALPH|nr:hypothetical protein E2I00_012593 [Balaenoptera physalus]
MKNTMGTNLFLSNPLLKEHQHTTMEESDVVIFFLLSMAEATM